MSSEAVNPELFIFKIFVSHQSYRIWSLACCQCKWSPGTRFLFRDGAMENMQPSFTFHQRVQPPPLEWDCRAACSGRLFISNINNETFELKKTTYTQNVLLYSIKIIQMFATLLGNWMDAFKVIYMGTLLKGGNEMAPVLTYLGTRATFIDSFMCTMTCALLYCSFTSRAFAQRPKGKKKKREK